MIGYFVYDPTTQKYVTKSGANPFGGVLRNFLKDPDFGSVLTTLFPSSSTGSSTSTTIPVVTTLPAIASTGTVSPTSSTIADITQAYTDRRYLTTISLANNYLAKNPAQKDVLRILYRTYFII